MKIVLINVSGSSGKTTLAKHLFTPQLPGARRIAIESINAGDGVADVEITARRFQALAGELTMAAPDEHYVIDIGASNAEAMLDHFTRLEDTRAEIDLWVIPAIPLQKQVTDALLTAQKLLELGVAPQQIALLPNMVMDRTIADQDFSRFLEAKKRGLLVPGQWVLADDLYEQLKNTDETAFSLVAGAGNLAQEKAAALNSGDQAAILAMGQRSVQVQKAKYAIKNLTSVFSSLPISQAVVDLETPAVSKKAAK